MSSEHVHWFCGINTTLVQEADFINSTCKVNGTIVASQFAFSIIFIITPIFLKCFTSYGKLPPSPYVFRLPGHSLRWILTFVYIVLAIAMIGEGILTNNSYISYELSGQPHLYVPGIFTIVAVVSSLVYYHMMEKWRARSMIWFLLVYWMWSIIIFVMRLVQLSLEGLNDWQICVYDITLVVVVLIGALFLNELILLYSLACHGCGDPLNAPKHKDTQTAFMKYRHDYSTLLSSVTFWWMNWLFILGYKKTIEPTDLGNIPEVHTSEYNHYLFKKNFEKEKERAARSGREISLYRVYLDTYSFKMLTGGLFKLAADCSNYVGPLCISAIIIYATTKINGTPEDDKALPSYTTVGEFFSNGYVLVGCIFISAVMKGMFDQCYQYLCFMEGLHVKSAIQSMVYEKSLRLSTYAMSGGMMTMGQVTNHMSLDATNVQQFFNWANELWTIPIKFAVTLYLLYLELGVPSLIGAALLVCVLPVQLIFAGFTSKYIKQVLLNSDQRMKYSNEMLQGIKILKLYGWERIYCKLVQAERAREMRELAKVYFIQAWNFVINIGIPTMVNLVSFSTYTALTGEPLSPDIAFSSLYLFNSLIDPMFIFPYVISLGVNSHISTKRIKFFLVAPEIEGKASLEQDSDRQHEVLFDSGSKKSNGFLSSAEEELDSTTPTPLIDGRGNKKMYGSMDNSLLPAKNDLPSDVAIRIKDGCFTWDPESHEAILKDINVDIPAGKLTIIVGTVGSGKSSILQAVLGEMTTLQGRIQISKESKVAYGPQKAWLVNASLRENILFGESYDPIRYRKVVEACALSPDIDMLPAGDRTEIGEKGLNLSGGQKQRVSVARTMYSGRNIVILDDPLSALDMHVGSHLFEHGILKILKKQKRTVILVTHQLQYLPEADKIIIMKNGSIFRDGDPDEIARADPSLMRDWQQAIQQMSESEAELSGGESEALLEERRILKRQISHLSSMSTKEASSAHDAEDDERGRLIITEDQEKGSVSYDIYLYYIKAIGYGVTLLVALGAFGGAGVEIGTNFWLATWSEASLNTNDTKEAIDDANYYIKIYGILSAFNVLFRMMYVAFICFGMYFAAKKLHHQMLINIISVPLRFFDTTPTGRILNRLSSDTQLIDQRLVQSMRLFVNISVVLLSAFVIIIAVNIYFILFVIPIVIVFIILMIFYVVTTRELQRCESVTRSPIFAHFSETLGGLPTLRAFKDEKRFFQTALDRILTNNRVFTYLITAQRWVGIRLDMLGAVVVLFSSLLCLLGAFYFGIDVSLMGLAISYSLEISLFMNLSVKAAAEVELQMNAVERVKYYAELSTEDYSGTEPPSTWPDKGLIKMENISVRYAQDLDAVLTDVNLTIPDQNKLGICGRTGSGKSSLTLALFRIIDTFKGRIIIDGIDIATVPLLTLRQRISIIPQDAFLFTGTIRSNLDPTNDKCDEQLWKALEIAQLKDIVTQLGMGLDYQVTEGGDNFSVGQRQLFCLARAFLRNSKIVVMDEATASIDQETDLILQDVVADVFQDRTVLTIAHRVSTIMNADSILTLQDGKVIEYDSPGKLLEEDTGMFASLVKAGK
ncbi:ATP-binding cassette sub-family C member 9-like isoform X1 [Lytechinus variegatus]|uniref:ATP-binding cassette sub-family C member 9-like isoform X1 n=1 Tax=Lytechinus variegatus TaxID=7654 RepID=UPI001BB2A15C|nr:ATP-binding cassette sub-family C member 9-like isoform X1 [Lytechinus variegatus]XP_041459435.1 ATP-binding cassette sub-family C member 9-like isoform X1 [Lytechinus variegatus]